MLHVRQVLFVVQMVTLLFTLSTLYMKNNYSLYFWVLYVCICDVMVRYYMLCQVGERLVSEVSQQVTYCIYN